MIDQPTRSEAVLAGMLIAIPGALFAWILAGILSTEAFGLY